MKSEHREQVMMDINDDLIVCFRVNPEVDHRISLILGPKYSTRSRFIRAAIQSALLQEEGQARLRKAHAAIEWG